MFGSTFVITPQLVFMVLGIASFVASAILAVVAITYFFRQDIRGVMDDLSGRTRRRGDEQGRRAGGRQRKRGNFDVSVERDNLVREVPGGVVQPSEDELNTVLDTQLRAVPKEYSSINSDNHDVNDDIPTVVTSLGDYHRNDEAETELGDADDSTVVDEWGDDAATQVEDGSSVGDLSFVVTRSVVAIHSNEVITAG